jgi:hypothetical protein
MSVTRTVPDRTRGENLRFAASKTAKIASARCARRQIWSKGLIFAEFRRFFELINRKMSGKVAGREL